MRAASALLPTLWVGALVVAIAAGFALGSARQSAMLATGRAQTAGSGGGRS